jgi:anti-sigma factor RsiW
MQMNCQAIDVKAYALNEAPAAERREAELHLKSCGECREELARLEFVQAALGGLREEEPPRRIAFVSDKVFEPSWWQRFWASGPRVGFAGAGLLSAAILVHGLTRPPVIMGNGPVVAQVSDQEIERRIDSAVTKAVAQIDAERKSEVQQLLAATEKKYELEQKALAVAWDENRLFRKQLQQSYVQNAGLIKQ